LRRGIASVRFQDIPSLVATLVALFWIASVVVTVLPTAAAHAGPAVPSAHQAAIENAKRARELNRPFTIAVLPDTQGYTALGQPGFAKQIEWLLANAADRNIVFVTHLGDVVDTGTDDAQWANARDALNPLLAQNRLPFSIIRGNHDDPGYFLKNLPLSLMRSKPWFVAASPSGLSQAQMFKVQQAWFLHIGFENNPTAAELQWANELLKRPSLEGMPVIVSAHDYMDGDGRDSAGSRIWDAFVEDNPMVFMVLCGHVAEEHAFVEHDAANRPVYEMLSDYQHRDFGGNGLMRLITVDPVNDTIEVKTFSPYYQYKNGARPNTNYYETDADSQFQYPAASGFWVDIRERLAFDTSFDFWGIPVYWW